MTHTPDALGLEAPEPPVARGLRGAPERLGCRTSPLPLAGAFVTALVVTLSVAWGLGLDKVLRVAAGPALATSRGAGGAAGVALAGGLAAAALLLIRGARTVAARQAAAEAIAAITGQVELPLQHLALADQARQERCRARFSRLIHCRDVTMRTRAGAERASLLARPAQAERLEAIGRLAGGVAHDFNNLLGAILMYADLLGRSLGTLQEPDGERHASMRRDLDQITGAAEQGARLVKLLLLGRRELAEPAAVDVNGVVATLEDLARDTLGEGIRLRLRLSKDSATAAAERSGVERVLMNLVVNARDAMPAGGTVTIETATVDVDVPLPWAPELAPGRYVRLSVSDTGLGMTREVRARAFEPFFTTKSPGAGNGLGLAAVHGIVKQAGGDIHLFSQATVGTIMRVYLPAAPELARDALPSGPPARSAPSSAPAPAASLPEAAGRSLDVVPCPLPDAQEVSVW
jgi:signal transduction histidine kinase